MIWLALADATGLMYKNVADAIILTAISKEKN